MSQEVPTSQPQFQQNISNPTAQTNTYKRQDDGNLSDDFDMADDFNKYAVTQIADLPKPNERSAIRTKGVKDVASIINFKNIKTTIQDYEVKKGGLFKSDVVTF